MYKKTIILFTTIFLLTFQTSAQDRDPNSRHGNTLNLGFGIGYYGYIGNTLPVFHINYELDVARNFTLAPFISFYSYNRNYYWGDDEHTYRIYHYRQTVIPIGIKGTYYFDDLLGAGPKWDFYLAGSLGFAIVRTTWDDDYYGDRNYYRTPSPLFLDLHIGAEYHLNNRLGLFLDLSSGVSTLGIAIH